MCKIQSKAPKRLERNLRVGKKASPKKKWRWKKNVACGIRDCPIWGRRRDWWWRRDLAAPRDPSRRGSAPGLAAKGEGLGGAAERRRRSGGVPTRSWFRRVVRRGTGGPAESHREYYVGEGFLRDLLLRILTKSVAWRLARGLRGATGSQRPSTPSTSEIDGMSGGCGCPGGRDSLCETRSLRAPSGSRPRGCVPMSML